MPPTHPARAKLHPVYKPPTRYTGGPPRRGGDWENWLREQPAKQGPAPHVGKVAPRTAEGPAPAGEIPRLGGIEREPHEQRKGKAPAATRDLAADHLDERRMAGHD